MTLHARASKCRPALAPLLIALGFVAARAQEWPQWGGPHRNFYADSAGLAASWPEGGPRQLWRRELGFGHSSIVVDGDRLYTMYRNDSKEVVIALDPNNGRTVWE